jgi:hypothetical protein
MRQHPLSSWLCAALCAACVSAPAVASAEVFSFSVAGKGNTFHGSGDLFQRFDNRFGGGAEVGIEVFFVKLFGEAVILGSQQYLFTANLGFDVGIGKQFRLTLGAFTGPMFFLFPEVEQEPIVVDCAELPTEYRGDCADIEGQLNEYQEQEENLSRLAVGWNLVRPRIDLDVRLAPGVYFGVGAQGGYHLLLTGEQAAAGAKNEAINKFGDDNDIPDDDLDTIRGAVGAQPVDLKNLNGFNYEVQVHLRVELGT